MKKAISTVEYLTKVKVTTLIQNNYCEIIYFGWAQFSWIHRNWVYSWGRNFVDIGSFVGSNFEKDATLEKSCP